MDQPVIDYGNKSRKSEKSLIGTNGEKDEMDALSDAWLKNRNGKTFVGQQVNLNDFVSGKI